MKIKDFVNQTNDKLRSGGKAKTRQPFARVEQTHTPRKAYKRHEKHRGGWGGEEE